jgi:hypothetical protein
LEDNALDLKEVKALLKKSARTMLEMETMIGHLVAL